MEVAVVNFGVGDCWGFFMVVGGDCGGRVEGGEDGGEVVEVVIVVMD